MRNKNKQLLIANVHPLRLCSTILFQISKVLLIRPFPAEREKNKLWGSWERKYNCAYTNGWHVIFAHVTDLRIKCYARISPHFFNKVLNWRPFPAIDEKTKIPTPSFFRKIRTRRFRYLIFSQQTLHGCRNDLPLNSHVLSTSSVLRNFSWRGSFSAIWWSFVFGVRFLWRQSLTPYSCVQTNVLAKFVDMICIFFCKDPVRSAGRGVLSNTLPQFFHHLYTSGGPARCARYASGETIGTSQHVSSLGNLKNTRKRQPYQMLVMGNWNITSG